MTGRDRLLKECLKLAEKFDYNGIFLLPTGSGKGKLMIEIAKLLQPQSILYLCNTTLLRDKTFKAELYKWDAAYLLNRMDLQCYQTACKWVGKHYNLLLADEFDAALTPEYIKAITNNRFDKRILVSATLDEKKLRLAKKIAPIIHEVKPLKLIKDKVLNKVQFYFVNYNLTTAENTTYLHYNLEFKKLLNQVKTREIEQKLETLQLQRKHFLNSLGSSREVAKWLIQNIEKTGEKIIIFCGLSKQADAICKYAYHNRNDEEQLLKDFDSGKIKKIAVVNKIDRGENLQGVKNIIHESISKSKTRLTQRTGRGMRLDVDDTLNVFFMIPHFLDKWGNRKPTIVQQWVLDSTKDMDLSNAKTISYKT